MHFINTFPRKRCRKAKRKRGRKGMLKIGVARTLRPRSSGRTAAVLFHSWSPWTSREIEREGAPESGRQGRDQLPARGGDQHLIYQPRATGGLRRKALALIFSPHCLFETVSAKATNQEEKRLGNTLSHPSASRTKDTNRKNVPTRKATVQMIPAKSSSVREF